VVRPITAELRGIEDDGRRWWAVAGRQYGTPWFYPARSGREAVAAHRRDSIAADVQTGHSRREATFFVRALGLTYDGPHTTREAFVLDAGWHLAQAECDAYRGELLVPVGPMDDLDACKPMLTDQRIELILDTVAGHYQVAAAPCELVGEPDPRGGAR
jgi:hypothetical protein